jgi:hypothetical protein
MKLEKAYKNLDVETVKELEALDEQALKKRVVEANQAMQQVANELEANEEYQELKESLKAMSAGKREVNKRQNSVITVCLHMLESKGVE